MCIVYLVLVLNFVGCCCDWYLSWVLFDGMVVLRCSEYEYLYVDLIRW